MSIKLYALVAQFFSSKTTKSPSAPISSLPNVRPEIKVAEIIKDIKQRQDNMDEALTFLQSVGALAALHPDLDQPWSTEDMIEAEESLSQAKTDYQQLLEQINEQNTKDTERQMEVIERTTRQHEKQLKKTKSRFEWTGGKQKGFSSGPKKSSVLNIGKANSQGTEAEIYHGLYYPTPYKLPSKTVVMKKLKRSHLTDEDLRRRLFREGKMWEKLHHPNVVDFLGVFGASEATGAEVEEEEEEEESSVYLVSVFSFLACIDQETASCFLQHEGRRGYFRIIISGVLAGMQYLTEMHVIHGDLKGNNVIIFALPSNEKKEGENTPRKQPIFLSSSNYDNIVAKITDFGRSRIDSAEYNAKATQVGGASRYVAPEMWLNDLDCITLEADVWAFGVTMQELALVQLLNDADAVPFFDFPIIKGQDPLITFYKAEEGGLIDQKMVDYLYVFPEGIRSLIKSCWSKEPKARPGIAEIQKRWEELFDVNQWIGYDAHIRSDRKSKKVDSAKYFDWVDCCRDVDGYGKSSYRQL